MPDALLVQNLGVSFQRDDNGREGLVYAPTEILPEDPRSGNSPGPTSARI